MKKLGNENLLLGKRLRLFREQRGFSAEQVASSIGVAVSTYREWENGRAISGQPYMRLATALDVGVYQILGIEDQRKSEIALRLEQVETLLREARTLL